MEAKYMPIKYYKFLDLLNRRGIKKSQLRELLGFGPNTIAKFDKHEPVSFEVLEKICNYFDVQPGEIMEFVRDKTE